MVPCRREELVSGRRAGNSVSYTEKKTVRRKDKRVTVRGTVVALVLSGIFVQDVVAARFGYRQSKANARTMDRQRVGSVVRTPTPQRWRNVHSISKQEMYLSRSTTGTSRARIFECLSSRGAAI